MKTIEELYKKSFEDFEKKPNPKNWTNIDKKISKPSFLKFSATSFNIYYFVAIILLVASVAIILQETNSTEKILAISKNANLILNNKEILTTNNNENIIYENKTEQNISNKTNISSNISDNKNNEVKIISGTSTPKEIHIATTNTNEQTETTDNNAKKLEKRKSQMIASCNISLLEGCVPLKVDFTNKSQNYNSADWDLGNGVLSNEQTVTYTYTKPGMYIISLTVTNNEDTKIIYDTVNVHGKPIAEFEVNKKNIYKNQEIEFINKSEYAQKLEWNFGDGIKSNDENPTHKYSEIGNYKVKLITIANNQCSDTALFEINIKKDDTKIIFPNAIRPNLTGSTGGYYTSNTNKSSIFCPVTEENVTSYQLRIYNKRGALLFESREINKGWDGYYNNELMPIGVYIYEAKGTFESGDDFYLKGDITLIHSQQN